jgi:hypothetical protein
VLEHLARFFGVPTLEEPMPLAGQLLESDRVDLVTVGGEFVSITP